MSPIFRYQPTGETIEATGDRAARYRRNHRFLELDPPETDEDGPDSPEPTLKPPQGTVPTILAWAGTDPTRIEAALTYELANKNRSTLVKELNRRLR